MELDLALDTSLTVTSPYDAAIQELDLLLSTESTQVLGNVGFGVSMEQFLWQLTPSPTEVQSYIQNKILENTFWCNKLGVQISVETVQGTIRDIYLVHISLVDPETGSVVKKRTYTYN